MILDFRIKGYKVYSEEVGLSLRADPSVDRFCCNVFREGDFSVLKTACVYGPNNSGKTCIVDAVGTMTRILKDEIGNLLELDMLLNLFSEDGEIELGVSFLYGGKAYDYEFIFEAFADVGVGAGFIYERFSELSGMSDEEGRTIFERDVKNGRFFFDGDDALSEAMSEFSSGNILIYSATGNTYPALDACGEILRGFADEVDVVDMTDITPGRTMADLLNDPSVESDIEEFVKCADLDIDRFAFLRPGTGNDEPADPDDGTIESRIRAAHRDMSDDDVYRLISFHKGVARPSAVIDSSGTMKIISLASHMIDAVKNGRTLVIDELDNGLHSRLTRAIVLLFDDELNDKGQLIFTTHDMTLLDCEKLFRKDQVWFVDKDRERAYLYSVSDVDEDGDGSDGDTLARYRYGEFGAIPSPRFDSVLTGRGNRR